MPTLDVARGEVKMVSLQQWFSKGLKVQIIREHVKVTLIFPTFLAAIVFYAFHYKVAFTSACRDIKLA